MLSKPSMLPANKDAPKNFKVPKSAKGTHTILSQPCKINMFQRPSSTLATRESSEGNSPPGTAAELWANSPNVPCLATFEAPPVLV